MSIASEIERIQNNINDTYSSLDGLGADMPSEQNTDNLAETVLTIKAVRYSEQQLTEEQKAQARENIGAGEPIEVDGDLLDNSTNPVQNKVVAEKISSVESTLGELDGRVGGLEDGVQEMETSTLPEMNERIGKLEAEAITQETDPTVPSWAKQATKPAYTASEVGARPDTWTPTYSDVGADKSGTASSAVSSHNANTDAHNDIRLLIAALTERMDAFANSDDDTLDQMAEIVAYIKDNRGLIDQITTGKVNVTDIVNNLTTNVNNKPLSAAQGVALKALIDAIVIPTKLSELTNDKGYLTSFTETDPTVPSWAKESTKPSYTKSEVGLSNVDNVKQYSASNPPPYPVTSVNGKTGAVTLDASAVNARPSTWTPSASDVGAVPTSRTVNGKALSSNISLAASDVGALPSTTKIPSKVSDLTNDSGFITGYTETDPTVPSWAKAASKPSYTKSEVGLANVDNVKQYSASNPPPYPVTKVNNKTGAVTLSASDVGADASGTASSAVSTHNSSTSAHSDIRASISQLSSEKVNQEQVATAIEEAIADLKEQGIQQTPLFANSTEECTDTDKMYVLPDGYIYACLEKVVSTEGTTIPNFTNLFETATVKSKLRYSLSGKEWKSYEGDSIILPIPSELVGKSWTLRVKPYTYLQYVYLYSGHSADVYEESLVSFSNTTGEQAITVPASNYKYVTFAVGSSANLIITANQEITYTKTEGGTQIVKEWVSTGHAFVPADYEDRIVELEAEVETLNNKLKKVSVSNLSVSEVFAPSPQLPADGSETADFNGDRDYITAEQICAKIDELLNLYPRFITKEVMGKDASGNHDWCRYICSRRTYDAWQKPNYPPMYAWTNGSTTIYSVSVSPRIGDTLYTTTYVGTAKGTVTAVSNANETRTVGGVAYKRDKGKDIEPTLVYTETAYSPYFSSNYASLKNGIYDSTKSKISTISSMTNGTLKDANGVTYSRYPFGDRDSNFKEIPTIVIGGNEHGTGGDPATPSMISARMIKDLCECKNANNPFINLLKNEYMLVVCPVVNPWGLHKDNKSYYNANGVNLDRNFDTIGWGGDTTYPQGAYGGSENETQYFMNTLVASKCKIAMCNHSYGHGLDNTTGEAVSGGICSYMFGDYWDKYNDSLLEIAEVMASNYNLVFKSNDANGAPALPNQWAKTRSYFASIGIDGVALEINSRDGFITDPTNEAQGKQFTARVMEAGYTQLLQALYMLIDKA